MTTTQSAVSEEALASISTPDRVESRLGTLEFDDGAPSEATAALLYDNLDFQHGVQAFLGALRGASLAAIRRGFLRWAQRTTRSCCSRTDGFRHFPHRQL